jgi:hypothetical protein
MAKSTVVSTLPFELVEPKPGLIPSIYVIPSAKGSDFSYLHVADGHHLVLIPLTDSKTPPMRVTDTSERISQSLIDDYVNASLSIDYTPNENGSIAIPGLFWVEGALNRDEIVARHSDRVKAAKNNTMAWFERLVKLADDDWAKNESHRTITDLQRKACTYLNIDRAWNFDIFKQLSNLCWACKSIVNPLAIICHECNAVLNVTEYEKNKNRFVPATK